MLIDDQPHCAIEYDPDARRIIQTWKGFAKPSEFRASIQKTIDAFERHRPTTILSDTRESEVVDQAEARWVVEYANPALIARGLKKIAFVLPKKLLPRWSVDHFFRGAKDQPLEARAFNSIAEARAWLAEESEES